MQLSQIYRAIELCPREIIFRFEMNLQNFLFLGSSIQICILMEVPKYLATGLYRHSGTYSPPAECSTHGLKCQTNLIHQICISATEVSSGIFRSKKLKIRKIKGENWESSRMKTKQSAINLSQIHLKIYVCLKDTILCFEMNFMIYLFFDISIHIRILKQVPKYLVTQL
jgi:hypothetical protein